MSSNPAMPAPEMPLPVSRKSSVSRVFYPASALLLLALMLIGFSGFYFRGESYPGRPITPPIRTEIIVHGVSMTAWMLLFVLQPMLIAARRHKWHMALGKVAAVLAIWIVASGVKVGIDSSAVMPAEARVWKLTPLAFMAIPLLTMATFAVFIAIGVWKRKRPAVHRAMMLLGTLAALGAAVSRIDAINNLYVDTVIETAFGPFLGVIVIGLALVMIKWLLDGKLDRPLATGFAVLTVVFALVMPIARTGVWEGFARMLVGHT